MRYRSDAILITVILIKICFHILLGHTYIYIYVDIALWHTKLLLSCPN